MLRSQPPSVTVSGTTPTLAAALASLSALLPPMNRAGISLEALGRLGEMVSSRERTGSEYSSSLNFELSSVRRVKIRAGSAAAESGGIEPRKSARPGLSKRLVGKSSVVTGRKGRWDGE